MGANTERHQMLYDELTPSQTRQCTRCRNGYIDQIADLKAEVQRLENNVRVYHEALNKMGRETGWAKRKIDSLLGKEKKGKNEQHRPENHPGKTQDVAE